VLHSCDRVWKPGQCSTSAYLHREGTPPHPPPSHKGFLWLPLRCCDFSHVLATYRTAPPVEIQESMLVLFLCLCFKQNRMENCSSQKPSHGKTEPSPGHSGSGKDGCAPAGSMTWVSDCEAVLAMDQGAKAAELLPSVVLEQIPSLGPFFFSLS